MCEECTHHHYQQTRCSIARYPWYQQPYTTREFERSDNVCESRWIAPMFKHFQDSRCAHQFGKTGDYEQQPKYDLE